MTYVVAERVEVDSDDSHGDQAGMPSGATGDGLLQTASARLPAANHVTPVGRQHVLHLHVNRC